MFSCNAVASVFSTEEIETLKQNFFTNIMPDGAIIASPSKSNPCYYYDWTRDSAISMDLIQTWYEQTKSSKYKEKLLHYVEWVSKVQHQVDPNPGQNILGEPKFYLNGTPYDGDWGRPQNDGPAIRAQTLIRFANTLIQDKKDEDKAYVKSKLYAGGLDPHSMGAIKIDLEYIAHHWQEKNFDLWEEIYGDHFFNAMVQRQALQKGAELARELGELEAGTFYEQQATLIENRLKQHIDLKNKIVQETLPPHTGPQKKLELDTAVILATLFTDKNDGVFTPSNPYILNTAKLLTTVFKEIYPINQQHENAILFGRYPGDTYDGYQINGIGNPWFILTATMAEYYYRLAKILSPIPEHGPLVKNYIQKGDDFLKLIKLYAPNLKMDEQINLNTGLQQGASSLTWSYVSVLRAIEAEKQLKSTYLD